MKTYIVKASKEDADRIRCARGFSSFKDWARQNKEGRTVNTQRGRLELVQILENEHARFIAPNL